MQERYKYIVRSRVGLLGAAECAIFASRSIASSKIGIGGGKDKGKSICKNMAASVCSELLVNLAQIIICKRKVLRIQPLYTQLRNRSGTVQDCGDMNEWSS